MTLPTFVMERTFDAPKDLVWRTWTEATLVSRIASSSEVLP